LGAFQIGVEVDDGHEVAMAFGTDAVLWAAHGADSYTSDVHISEDGIFIPDTI
jgi:hypothetical protein